MRDSDTLYCLLFPIICREMTRVRNYSFFDSILCVDNADIMNVLNYAAEAIASLVYTVINNYYQ